VTKFNAGGGMSLATAPRLDGIQAANSAFRYRTPGNQTKMRLDAFPEQSVDEAPLRAQKQRRCMDERKDRLDEKRRHRGEQNSNVTGAELSTSTWPSTSNQKLSCVAFPRNAPHAL
jgi:hypothetical protein